jgi:hypothetical protein
VHRVCIDVTANVFIGQARRRAVIEAVLQRVIVELGAD